MVGWNQSVGEWIFPLRVGWNQSVNGWIFAWGGVGPVFGWINICLGGMKPVCGWMDICLGWDGTNYLYRFQHVFFFLHGLYIYWYDWSNV